MAIKTKARTILFTEACPLDCRYCYLKDDYKFGANPGMSHEEVLRLVAKYDLEDDPKECNTQLVFSGGEPFLYYDWIKEILLKYGNRFQYLFNTSGYCFTEEMLEFLSRYNITFVLSVDGDEKLTNYLRPVISNRYKTGYYKKLKSILPTLLYYFPKTPFRIIVNPRYLDLLHEQYLEAERLGFKFFTIILDFETRPDKPMKGQRAWTPEDTKELQKQFDLIVEEIAIGFATGIARPQVVGIDSVVSFLMKDKPFSPYNLPCQVFSGRSNATLQQPNSEGYCMARDYPKMEDAADALEKAYVDCGGRCKSDNNCRAFEYCATYLCPKNSLVFRGEFFDAEPLECALNKVMYESALKLLTVSNEVCPEAKLYTRYLNKFDYDGKEAIINGNLLPM